MLPKCWCSFVVLCCFILYEMRWDDMATTSSIYMSITVLESWVSLELCGSRNLSSIILPWSQGQGNNGLLFTLSESVSKSSVHADVKGYGQSEPASVGRISPTCRHRFPMSFLSIIYLFIYYWLMYILREVISKGWDLHLARTSEIITTSKRKCDANSTGVWRVQISAVIEHTGHPD